MQERFNLSSTSSDAENLELYEEIIANPKKIQLPEQVRSDYAKHFQEKSCPVCGDNIEMENHGVLNGIEYMICQKDGCWTLSYISSKHLEASSYLVTFTCDEELTTLQAAKLAREIVRYSRNRSIENPVSITSDMFPNILETKEGWIWVHFVPLLWSFEYENIYDEEDLKELKALPFSERVNSLKARHWDQLADYGWTDTQEGILEEMQRIEVDGVTLEVTVSQLHDSKVQMKEEPLDYFLN